MNRALVATTLAAFMGLAALSHAQAVPTTVGFTSMLRTADGPVDGPVELVFRIYDAETGGTELWTETQSDLFADEGLVFAELGIVNPLDETTFDGSDVWLEVEVDGDLMTPRLVVDSVPYAIRATVADRATQLGTLSQGDVVTGVTAGTGLLGGGNGGDVTLSLDTSAVQSTVTGTCAPGGAIRVINTDGTVVCEADDDTSYTAGTGLNLAGTTFSVDTSAVQARVSSSCAPGSSIRAITANGAVTCEPDDDSDTTYGAGTGLLLSGTTFSIDTTTTQARVSQTCPVGSSIRAIAANGTVACEPDTDTDTTYAAGTGLALTGTTFDVDDSIIARKDAAAGNQGFANGTLYLNYATGRTGIGLSTPAAKLHVFGDAMVSGDFQYQLPRTYQHSILGGMFQGYENQAVVRTPVYIHPDGTFGMSFWARVNLPQGSTIQYLNCYFYDSTSSADMAGGYVDLRAHEWGTTGLGAILAQIVVSNFTDSSNVITVTDGSISSIGNPVNNSQRAYYLNGLISFNSLTATSGIRFYGCRIDYHLSEVSSP